MKKGSARHQSAKKRFASAKINVFDACPNWVRDWIWRFAVQDPDLSTPARKRADFWVISNDPNGRKGSTLPGKQSRAAASSWSEPIQTETPSKNSHNESATHPVPTLAQNPTELTGAKTTTQGAFLGAPCDLSSTVA
jgi:hypothetical protein